MPLWFIGLWVIVLGVAIFSRSLIANLAFMFVCVLGYHFAGDLEIEVVRWGVIAIFLCGIGFSALQLLTSVNKI